MSWAATLMFAEAAEAADVIARQLTANRDAVAAIGARLRRDPPPVVVTCARGSSDHAATYLKHLVEARAGVLVASASPSIASVYHQAPIARAMLAIGLSQSGASPDLLATLRAAAQVGARTLALVNVEDSPLARLADAVLPLHAGAERSVAATKSFLATMTAAAALVAAWTQDAVLAAALDALPDGLRAAWASDWSPLVEALADARGLYVIGRGPGFGAAQEIALKLKETCGLHAEAFSAAEVRHGPMALIGPGFPLLVIRQEDEAAPATDALVEDMVAQGAPVLVAGRPARGATALPLPPADPRTAPILAVQAFYRAADALSLRRGHDPDRPPLLRKVTETV
ncbi:SIS domain-containing protein [uncultured Sphingomonas sp.]|uniref:SIS domain-containing protein n=1 Tax=uncultured Sphingomonas sp. TaxID=158754 RepID=UPI0035CC68CD